MKKTVQITISNHLELVAIKRGKFKEIFKEKFVELKKMKIIYLLLLLKMVLPPPNAI